MLSLWSPMVTGIDIFKCIVFFELLVFWYFVLHSLNSVEHLLPGPYPGSIPFHSFGLLWLIKSQNQLLERGLSGLCHVTFKWKCFCFSVFCYREQECLLRIRMLLKVLSFAIFNLDLSKPFNGQSYSRRHFASLYFTAFFLILCSLLDGLNCTELTASDSENNNRKTIKDKNWLLFISAER